MNTTSKIFFAFLTLIATSNAQDDTLECAICQLFENLQKPQQQISCHDNCQTPMSQCEIFNTLFKRVSGLPNSLENTFQKCRENNLSEILSIDISSNTCTVCFLVYETLKSINSDILEGREIDELKKGLTKVCKWFRWINHDLCHTLTEIDTVGSIVQALKHSLTGFYDLVAVRKFNCPSVKELFHIC